MLEELASNSEITSFISAYPRKQRGKVLELVILHGIRSLRRTYKPKLSYEQLVGIVSPANLKSSEQDAHSAVKDKLHHMKSELEAMNQQISPSPRAHLNASPKLGGFKRAIHSPKARQPLQ